MAACEKCDGTAVVLVMDECGAPSDPVAGWLMCDECLAVSEQDGEWCNVVLLEDIDEAPHNPYLGESPTLARIDAAQRRRVVGRPPAATDEDVAEMARLYDTGMTLQAVGDELGFSLATVHRQLTVHGHAMRSRGARPKVAA